MRLLLLQTFIFLYVRSSLPDVKMSIGPIQDQEAGEDNMESVVYENQSLMEEFDIDAYPFMSCVPNNLTKFKVGLLDILGNEIQQYYLPLTILNNMNESLSIRTVLITNYYDYQEIDVTPKIRDNQQLLPQQTMVVDLIHFCVLDSDNSNYWSIEEVSLRFTNYDSFKFQYQFLCNTDYHPQRFDWSNIILIIFESIAVLILAKFGKFYTFKLIIKADNETQTKDLTPFQGFELYWGQALFYMSLLILSLFVSMIFQEQAELPIKIIIYIMCAICTFHFIDELFCVFRKDYPIIIKPIYYLRVCDICSIMIAAAIIIIYLVLDQPWFISNVITICLLGSLIKIFKLTSLKDAILFFGPIMIVDILCSVYLGITIRYEWDAVALRYFNTPFSAQIPYFRYIYKKKCCWVSVFNILFPGFFLGYIDRFDNLKQTYVYKIVGFIGLLIGLVLWVVVQFLISFPLPTSIFTQTLIVSTCALISYTRNEFNLLWTGEFYDEVFEDPFKNELDKASVKVINFFGLFQSRRQNSGFIKSQKQHQIIQEKELVKTINGQVILDDDLFMGMEIEHQQDFKEKLNYFKNKEKQNNYQPPNSVRNNNNNNNNNNNIISNRNKK